MKTQYLFILAYFLFIFAGCSSDYDIEEGQFPTTPVNFEDINSEYDDYNSALPYNLYHEVPYLFSSNRNTNGEKFDIVGYTVEFYYNPDLEKVYFYAVESNNFYYNPAIAKINTASNELGPYITYSLDYLYDLLFYATDSSGNLDIYYTYNYVYEKIWKDPLPLNKINTDEHNEAYPAFNKTRDEFYFCSDDNDHFDMYKVNLNNSSIINWFDTEEVPQKIGLDILNSDLDEKCPYINRDLMVFTSNREGGYGGYDLYYSEFIDGAWSNPVNFGETINTEYDEFRPVALYVQNYTNDVMLFSSNRPGGKGGFDLYYVGIPKMIIK